MNKVLSIAQREYLAAVRSKAFIIGILITPLILAVVITAQRLAEKKVDLSDRRVGVVDRTGVLLPLLQNKAQAYNESDIFETDGDSRKQTRPRFVFEAVSDPPADLTELELQLSDRVRNNKLFAFLIIEKNVVDPDAQAEGSIYYYTDTTTYEALPGWIRNRLNDSIRELRFAQSQIDAGLVKKLTQPAGFREMGLARKTKDRQVAKAEQSNRFLDQMVPFAGCFLLYFVVMSTCPQLLNSVLEEKMQKIAELLVSSVTPFELMLGKLLGAVGIALTLSTLYVGAGLYLADRVNALNHIPAVVYVWFAVYLFISLFMYGSIFTAIGAACSEIKDAQGMMTPAMMMLIVPMVCIMPILQSPNGPFAQAISLFPPTAPVPMLMRLMTRPGPPTWEIIASLVLTIAFALLCVWAGGKIFRAGLLRAGKPPSYRQLLGWILSRE